MTETTATLPLGRMLAVFVGIFLAANLVIAVVTYYAPDLAVPNTLGLVFLMAAAIGAGQTAAARMGRWLVAREKLVFATAATALVLVMSVAVMYGMLTYFGLDFSLQNLVAALTGEVFPPEDLNAFLPWFLLFAALLNFVVVYGFVGLGAYTHLRALEKKAARDAARGR